MSKKFYLSKLQKADSLMIKELYYSDLRRNILGKIKNINKKKFKSKNLSVIKYDNLAAGYLLKKKNNFYLYIKYSIKLNKLKILKAIFNNKKYTTKHYINISKSYAIDNYKKENLFFNKKNLFINFK
jgi:hypothetical protein